MSRPKAIRSTQTAYFEDENTSSCVSLSTLGGLAHTFRNGGDIVARKQARIHCEYIWIYGATNDLYGKNHLHWFYMSEQYKSFWYRIELFEKELQGPPILPTLPTEEQTATLSIDSYPWHPRYN